MNELSEYIYTDFLTRKTYKQKSAFIEMMTEHFPELKVDGPSGIARSRNLILGDLEKARYIFTAHYDTCAVLPFPNLIFINNIIATILYSVLIMIPLFFIALGVSAALIQLGASPFIALWSVYFILFLTVFWMYGGIPSKKTVNDNTSGVLTLIELYMSMSDDQKARTAIVFFDNEEYGLIGSYRFNRKYKNILDGKALVNFDCVSDGDSICFLLRGNTSGLSDTIRQCYDSPDKNFMTRRPLNTMYPSDQSSFKNSIGVCALHHCFLGYFIPRIHTSRDVILDRRNIEYLRDGSLKLIDCKI